MVGASGYRSLALQAVADARFWVYRRLRNFRAGIEAGISCFKRAYGAARCTWRGLDQATFDAKGARDHVAVSTAARIPGRV
jgi:hypothetical protein